MRYIGALLVTLAGLGLGLYYARRLHRRVDFLRRTDNLLEALLHRLTYAVLPMGDLWKELAEGGAFAGFSLLDDTVEGLSQNPFPQAFCRAVEGAGANGLLLAAEQETLLAFGKDCGRFGLEEQAAHIRACQGQIRQFCRQTREQALAKGQVYQMLGLAGGVGLSLLLL
ncbi:MAG: stage III sporulation protein AB [Clostridia bacterium]|nr:stage III sporulation protein AB [Clostridia bacterium]